MAQPDHGTRGRRRCPNVWEDTADSGPKSKPSMDVQHQVQDELLAACDGPAATAAARR